MTEVREVARGGAGEVGSGGRAVGVNWTRSSDCLSFTVTDSVYDRPLSLTSVTHRV